MPNHLNGGHLYEFDSFCLDASRGLLYRDRDLIPLAPKAIEILAALLERPQEVLTKEELIRQVWPDTYVEESNLAHNIAVLRKTLESRGGARSLIQTVPKRGYRFTGEVKQIHGDFVAPGSQRGNAAVTPDENLASSAAAAAARPRFRWRIALAPIGLALVAFAVVPGITPPRGPATEARLGPAVPLTSYKGIECCPSFSPDGTRVAFAWDGPNQDNFDIYVKLIGTGDPLRITQNAATDCFPAWSPDGRWIAFLRELSGSESSILLLPALAGGAEREVARVELANGPDVLGHELTWSKDGRFLFTSEKQGANSTSGIVRISVESGERKPITIPPAGVQGDSSPSVSPDGRTLAFKRVVSGHSISDIHIVPITDDTLSAPPEPRRVTFDGKWIDGYAWVNSREVIVLSDRGGRTEPWRISVFDRRGPVRFTGAAEYGGYTLLPLRQSLAISPETRRLVYMQANSSSWDIWRLPISGSKIGKATSVIGSTLGECSPEYSPDGRRIALHSNRSGRAQIWICDAGGSDCFQLTSFEEGFTAYCRWSPDGRKIVLLNDGGGQSHIYVVDSRGGKPLRLTAQSGREGAPSWSRDGGSIYFASEQTGRPEVWKSRIGGPALQVTKNGGFAALESLDGKHLYYTKSELAGSLWSMPVDGNEETQVIESVYNSNFTIVPRGIYFMQGTSNEAVLQFLDFSKETVRNLGSLGRWVSIGLTISPDQRSALYSKPGVVGSDLMLVENLR